MVQFFISIFYDFFDGTKNSQHLENKSYTQRVNSEEDIESTKWFADGTSYTDSKRRIYLFVMKYFEGNVCTYLLLGNRPQTNKMEWNILR